MDIARWAHALIGADGGSRSSEFCGPRSLPLSKKVGEGPRVTHFRVQLITPNNDVSQVFAKLAGTDTDQAPLSQSILDQAERVLGPLIEGLRALGGESTVASLDVNVACASITTRSPDRIRP